MKFLQNLFENCNFSKSLDFLKAKKISRNFVKISRKLWQKFFKKLNIKSGKIWKKCSSLKIWQCIFEFHEWRQGIFQIKFRDFEKFQENVGKDFKYFFGTWFLPLDFFLEVVIIKKKKFYVLTSPTRHMWQ